MKKRPKILVVGSFVMDLIVRTGRVPDEGETVIDGLSFNTACGGKGANQAVQAARLGADVTMIGKVGNDTYGAELIKSVFEANINTDYILKDNEVSSAVGNVILEVKDENKVKNRIIVVPGANMKLTIKDVKFLEEKISEFDMVIMQLEIPLEVNEAVTSYADKKRIPVMLNPAPSRSLSNDLLSKLTYISPNEHEASDLTGIRIKSNNSELDIDSVKKAAKVLYEKGVKNIIITLGSNGAAFFNKDKFIYKPCIDILKVVDPTAAGDSFTGAFCTGICLGLEEEEALNFANYSAAMAVSRMGAFPSLPTYKEVLDLITLNNANKNIFNPPTLMKILNVFENI